MPSRLPADRRIVVATGNAGKLREIRAILAGRGFDLIDPASLAAGAALRLPEEGAAYEANAIAKAQATATQLGLCALADDSGLEVDALAGAPGPYSARFGGPGLDDVARARHLLAVLSGVEGGAAARRARFVCWVALAWPAGDVATACGECRGVILDEPTGSGGFGYDPVFRPDGFEQSLAELPSGTKNRISHRGRALRALFDARGPEGSGRVTPRAG